MRTSPSSKSRRSFSSTFSQIASSARCPVATAILIPPCPQRYASGSPARRGPVGRRAPRGPRPRSGAQTRGPRRARPSQQRGRAHRGTSSPASASPRTRPRRAARMSGRVGVPSRRSTPATFPVVSKSPQQSRMSSAIWKAMPSARPNAPRPAPFVPLPRRHAASKSLPVFREQRARYSSTEVSGPKGLPPLQRLAACEGERRHPREWRPPPRRRSPRAARTPARRGSRRPPWPSPRRARPRPSGAPRRRSAPSRRSSWTSVAMCTSSTAAPPATERSPSRSSTGVERKTSRGRSRLPPAASVSAPTSPRRPGKHRQRPRAGARAGRGSGRAREPA